MIIQDRLAAFDRWLTNRIEEAYAARKDLAFRDLVEDESPGSPYWEYSLLEPGARSPIGEGWSVYRLSGIWPDMPRQPERRPASSAIGRRRSSLETIVASVLGRGPGRR